MGITNDAETACNQPLDKFRRPGVNFTLCPGCKKAATQHLIREHAQPCWFSTTGWPKIERSLYLKQEDGSSHSAEFENIVRSWVQRRHKELQDAGICFDSYDKHNAGYRLMYAPWSRAFLLDEWDGQDLSQKGAELLLAKYGEPPMVEDHDDFDVDIQASESVSNAGENFMATIEMLRTKIDEGTQQLIEWNVMILQIYRLLIEDEGCDDDRRGLMGVLDQLFEKRRELVWEMRETEEELDDAYRELFGLGKDVCYPFKGKVWEDLLQSVVPLPMIMGSK
ncbi:hypothetical protein FNAPI_13442 [Fusarium napiforme]|uniref:Uncharacterized protein n=1 Tax=Fusarium napiforme TaxID=42672 RepID=A0A8H5I5Y4_9HYPO|nr:hypothetical protein FNAPI_13442 [Fusarium napiforme]